MYGRGGVRVLTWNLFHGRSEPPAGRAQLNAFAALLDGWAWDVALLQEVPPWWPQPLALACGAVQRHRLTSRNFPLAPRRAVSVRNPDILKSGGGGCNAILVRGQNVLDQRALRLAWRPERRWAHGVRLEDGTWVVNLHATVRDPPRALAECRRAAEAGRAWAAGAPLVLGGDFNLRGHPELPGLREAAGHYVDHVFASGLEPAGPGEILDRGRLSDHAPVVGLLA